MLTGGKLAAFRRHNRSVEPDASIGAERGAVVVCVGVGDEREHLEACLRSVLAHTPEEVAIVVYGDSAEGGMPSVSGSGERVTLIPAELRAALAAAAPADAVTLSSDCVVADGWLAGLRDAAYVDSRVATATALSNDAGLASVALPAQSQFEQAAAALRAGSPRIRPRVRAAGGHCTYIRRSALELIEDFEDLHQLSRLCLRSGLCHVLADEVLVLRAGRPVPAETVTARGENDSAGPLTRSLGAARRALEGLSIVIDGRILSGPMNGTKLHVLELLAAVARRHEGRIRVIVTADLQPGTRALLEGLPGVEPTVVSAETRPAFKADLVHRPFQIDSPSDLAFLAPLADRLLITQQDLIAFHNPSYFRSIEAWEGYRALTRRAMAVADRVLFFSAHARDEALAEGLLGPGSATVVHIGVDHAVLDPSRHESSPPRGAERIAGDAAVMLCIGTDYRHKNRTFALRVLAELQRTHGWSGWLVFAGPHMGIGSSMPDEERLLEKHPRLREAVLDVGEVSEAEKEWLLRRASLVLYPTVYEGFGLVPFEAAELDVPCMWAKGTSLSEILPDSGATIIPWDVAASADRALALMLDEETRTESVGAIRDAAASLRWDTAAARLIEVYRTTCNDPPSPVGVLERAEGVMRSGLSEDAVRLVGPDGALPRELERPLLALASHPKLRAPVFSAIKAGYRASYRLRRGTAERRPVG